MTTVSQGEPIPGAEAGSLSAKPTLSLSELMSKESAEMDESTIYEIIAVLRSQRHQFSLTESEGKRPKREAKAKPAKNTKSSAEISLDDLEIDL